MIDVIYDHWQKTITPLIKKLNQQTGNTYQADWQIPAVADDAWTVAVGEPDISCSTLADGQLQVSINGIDIFDPVTGEVRSSDSTDIACWLVDTDYNGESFRARLAYFPDTGGRDHYKKLKTALKGEIDPDIWAQLNKTVSHPFPPPTTGKIAVKAITTPPTNS